MTPYLAARAAFVAVVCCEFAVGSEFIVTPSPSAFEQSDIRRSDDVQTDIQRHGDHPSEPDVLTLRQEMDRPRDKQTKLNDGRSQRIRVLNIESETNSNGQSNTDSNKPTQQHQGGPVHHPEVRSDVTVMHCKQKLNMTKSVMRSSSTGHL
jgi:hypothetical protein